MNPSMSLKKVSDKGGFVEAEYECGHTLRTPYGFKLIGTSQEAQKHVENNYPICKHSAHI